MKRTSQDNAKEFGALTSQGFGVRLAVLVACSVEKQDIQGRHAKVGMTKMTPAAFATEAGVSRQTVSNYLDKWDRMVAAGWDMARENLTPGDADPTTIGHDIAALRYDQRTQLTWGGITWDAHRDGDVRLAIADTGIRVLIDRGLK